ncbi:precorrin-8X methylmutase [Oscillatoria salina]|uniref:precorrin-8X methylmutase n=1 Tax=Oscillatoria salina TaxID=331517 RepID=UPI0013BC7BD8|nr:precorrin-8X methylmutase [Oscillatoria salina]MBZ8179965.1 cobalt-precorrin-8X methylmutase [Oscillatoria salina IIICB1]NET86810.1 cobalt-precorrin-8X methylmutase [Kamptonema sp. SIO1D9]
MNDLNHPILQQSFAIIDREIGKHNFTAAEYAIARRVIHATADFEYSRLIQFTPGAIASAISSLRQAVPIVTDVTMVKIGVATLVKKTWQNPLISAVELAPTAIPGKTRTETGLLQCLDSFPQAIYVFGNAPTALFALCSQLPHLTRKPAFVIGAPVGFVNVVESKQALAETSLPHILIQGRQGGSAVAAAILNALIILAWEASEFDSDE